MMGPGVYDDVATEVRVKTKALGVIVAVFSGDRGSGFSAQLPAHLTLIMPGLLRDMADQIEGSVVPLPPEFQRRNH